MKKNEEISKIIVEECKKRGISAAMLAKESGCTTRQIQYVFKGERGLSLDLADKALKALGKSFEIGGSK